MTTARSRLVLDVVTDAFLLTRIVSFQRGLPRDIVELARSPALRRDEDDAREFLDDDVHFRHPGSDRLVLTLAQYAIRGADMDLLQRLFRYYKEQPAYCRTQTAMSFRGVWLYAIERCQLAIAQWIQDQPLLACHADHSDIWTAVIKSRSTTMLEYVLTERPELVQHFHGKQVAMIARTGSVDMLLWIKEKTSRGIPYSVEAARDAAMRGHLTMVQHLHESSGGWWSPDIMVAAAAKGHLDIVVFLHENREEECSTDVMDKAAGNGHLDIVRFLHEKRTEGCTTDAMDRAAANGHLDVVKFLHENRTEGCTTDAIDKAAHGGHLEIVQFLYKNRSEGCTLKAVVDAAKNGHLAVLQFLHENHCVDEWSPAVMDAAAAGIDVVRFYREHRREGYTEEDLKAASSRHLDIVRFLHENRSEGCTTRAMDRAAGNGQLDIVRFLHDERDEGCTVEAVNLAAENGHLEIVRFLLLDRREGCSTKAMDAAAAQGHRDVVKYLLENNSEGCTSACLEAAIKHDWMDIVQTLVAKDPTLVSPQALRLVAENGNLALTIEFLRILDLSNLTSSVLPWTATDAAAKGHTEIVKLILERAPNCRHEHVIVGAAIGGNVETVRFLHENYHKHCTPSTLYEAARHGHVDVLDYLLRNCCVTPTKLILRAIYSGNLKVVQFVLDHWPEPCLAEAHEIAVRRDYPEIVEFLAYTISRASTVESLKNNM